MSTVLFGNPAAIDHATGQPVPGDRITTSHIADHYSDDTPVPLQHQIRTLTHDDGTGNHGAWNGHSNAAAPSWVESDNPELAEALASFYGCPVGRPAE